MRPVYRHRFVALTTTLLCACTTLAPPDYPGGHAANADATPTPVTPVKSALDDYRPASANSGTALPPAPVPAAQSESGGAHDHH